MDGNKRGDKMTLELQEMVAIKLITSTIYPTIKVNATRMAKLQLGKIVYLNPDNILALDPNDEAIVIIEDGGKIVKAYIGKWRYNNSYINGSFRTHYYKFSNYKEVKPLKILKTKPIYGDEFLIYAYLNTTKIV